MTTVHLAFFFFDGMGSAQAIAQVFYVKNAAVYPAYAIDVAVYPAYAIEAEAHIAWEIDAKGNPDA